MVHFTLNDLERVTRDPDKIRNLSVIAHVDHGKSTLTDSLFAGSGIIRMDQAGNRRVTDDRKDEAERCITIKSTGISLLFPASDYLPSETVLNVIDSPGHVDFSSEVTAALRASDGALVVVDCVEGVCVQTETVLRQALQESIKPVLVINKLDRFFLELKYNPEEIYQRLCRVIESVNVIISTYVNDNAGDFTVDPLKGNVAFTAGIMGWGFTLPQIANFYGKRFGKEKNILKNLWGDRFINSSTGKVSRYQKDESFIRGFNEYIIRPIKTIFSSCSSDKIDWNTINPLISKLNIELSKDERELTFKNAIKCIMQKWIPAHICLLDLAINHLPSPKQAQKYRVNNLYTGPLDDEIAESIRNCNPDGPLVIYISKMAPERPDDRSSRFLAFGRIFSGTIKPGNSVTILDANYIFGNNSNFTQNVNVTRVCAMIPKPTAVTSMCAGNTVSLMGLDKKIVKTATLCDSEPIYPIKAMSFSVAPVVQRAVEPQKPSDLPKLNQAIKQLVNGDSLVQCSLSENGECIIAGAGELHLEICLNDLQNYMGDSKIIVKDPVVNYCETITTTSNTVMAKSPNKHNRLFLTASPIDEILLKDALDGTVDLSKKPASLAKELRNKYDWDIHETKNCWGFYPIGGNHTNTIVNTSFGVQYAEEIRDSVTASLDWVSNSGPLMECPLIGVRFDIKDLTLHADAIHRGGSQIIPTARRAFYAAFLNASPRIMEPIYLVEISCPRIASSGCHQVLGKRRSSVFDESIREGTDLVVLKAYLPVAESFGFSADLRAATSGQAFPQMIFHHWDFVPGDPFDEGSLANSVVTKIRASKGLSAAIPISEQYSDTLK